ncbi:amidohydrolase [Carnobacterium pleistocenium]|uniref:amidohydrolase n=1 Tax=Carnobacterium pleistocenium TaxID=181073 RepID=UPI000556B9D0|nr:amidohydrolase [Carnobacterium pleistocenium]
MKLWKNGLFYTMEKEEETVSAVITDGEKIVATGEEKELKNTYDKEITEEVDLNGEIVFPGFVDSHLHLLWYGLSLARLNLNQSKSKKESMDKIRETIEQLALDEWLFVEGYNENEWQDDPTPITRIDLDAISTQHPLLVRRIDYHNVVINTVLINKIGIKDGQIYSGGGEIQLNQEGKVTGVLKDEATNLAINSFPSTTPKEQEEYLALAIEDLWSKGVTGAHSEDLHYFNGFEGTLKTFRDVIKKEKKAFRVHLLIHHEELEAYNRSEELFLAGDPFIELGAMKIFYDGTVGSRTALMTQPYAETANHGLQIQSDKIFVSLIKAARKAKLPVAIHILGDKAFEKVIATLREFPPLPGQLDRMIHTPWLSEELLKKAKNLPLIFDVQPQFMSSDLPWALDVLGENHPSLAFAWKSIKNAGFPLAGSSDAPIEIPNPFYGIHSAVTRTVRGGNSEKRYFPEEELSVFEALSLYTIGSATAGYKENIRGKIKTGYVSDFTILKKNPFMVEKEALSEMKVSKTVVGGAIVFKKNN